MRQIGGSGKRLELSARGDQQHAGRINPWYEFLRCGGDIGEHLVDASRRSGRPRKLSHSLSQVDVTRLRHGQRLPVKAVQYTERLTSAASARLSFGTVGNAP
jgi:hypothetical protein